MTLVQVVSGSHGGIGFAEALGEAWFALEAHAERIFGQPRDREHLPADLEHRGLASERERLGRSREGKAIVTKFHGVHRVNRVASRLFAVDRASHRGDLAADTNLA